MIENYPMYDNRILDFIARKYDTSMESIQQEYAEMKNKEILSQYHIWYQKNRGYYITWLLDEEGRRIKQAKRKSRKELEKVIIEHHKSLKQAGQTIGDLFDDFIEYKKDIVKPNTLMKYQSDFRRYFLTDVAFVNMPYKAIKKTDIDAFLSSVAKNYGLNVKAFNSVCSLLRQMLAYACDNDYISESPFRVKKEIKRICRNMRRKASDLETYTDEEIRLIDGEMERRYKQNPSDTASLGVLLCLELGTRIGELMGINIDDIDFADNTLYIHSQLAAEYDISDLDHIKRNGYKIVDYTKTPQGERILPLTERALSLISRIKAANKKYNYYHENYLFVNAKGIMTPKSVESMLKLGCRHIGIPYRSPHKIRKTFASSLLNNGVPVTTVQEMLGHSEPATTLRYYVFDNTDKKKAYENIKTVLDSRFEQEATMRQPGNQAVYE